MYASAVFLMQKNVLLTWNNLHYNNLDTGKAKPTENL